MSAALPDYDPALPAILGDKIIFVDTSGTALWTSDGTPAGTTLLTASLVNFRVRDPNGTGNYEFAVSGGLVYFSADDGVHGQELWRTDCTVAGTVLEADIEAGPVGSFPRDLHAAANALYFNATTTAYSKEPWILRH